MTEDAHKVTICLDAKMHNALSEEAAASDMPLDKLIIHILSDYDNILSEYAELINSSARIAARSQALAESLQRIFARNKLHAND